MSKIEEGSRCRCKYLYCDRIIILKNTVFSSYWMRIYFLFINCSVSISISLYGMYTDITGRELSIVQ